MVRLARMAFRPLATAETPPVVVGTKADGLPEVVMLATWQPWQPSEPKRAFPPCAEAFWLSVGGGSSMRMKSAKWSTSARPSSSVVSSGSSAASSRTPNCVLLRAQVLSSLGKSGFVIPISWR
jgi:hypothetical protein